MCPLATTASLSALASEKAANPGRAAGCTVHVGQRGVALHSNRYIVDYKYYLYLMAN